MVGFEPTTSWLQTTSSTKLSYILIARINCLLHFLEKLPAHGWTLTTSTINSLGFCLLSYSLKLMLEFVIVETHTRFCL